MYIPGGVQAGKGRTMYDIATYDTPDLSFLLGKAYTECDFYGLFTNRYLGDHLATSKGVRHERARTLCLNLTYLPSSYQGIPTYVRVLQLDIHSAPVALTVPVSTHPVRTPFPSDGRTCPHRLHHLARRNKCSFQLCLRIAWIMDPVWQRHGPWTTRPENPQRFAASHVLIWSACSNLGLPTGLSHSGGLRTPG